MIAVRIYRLALGAFPRRHRELYAAEMIDTFAHELAAARRTGAWRTVRFVGAATINALATGMAERRRHQVVRLGYAFSALDFTLAWRMLLRHPGLSIVGIFGMAVGIAVAAGAFTIVAVLMDTRLPLPEGDRIVSLVAVDASTSTSEMRVARDFTVWREMDSMAEVGISRSVGRNLIIEGRTPEPITVVEMSASSFRIAGVAAFRGRYLLPEDERPGGADTLVIGYDEWVRRFDGDPNVVGRTVQLGDTTYTIVGVMPDGFAFPANYGFWTPWRLDAASIAPRTGPRVGVFGRLEPGATIESAQAELEAVGRQAVTEWPATHQHMRPRVLPYVYAYTDMGDAENFLAMRAIQLAMVLLLIIVCVNVAILVYARTVTRQSEIAIRSALGASRLRITAQLFVEALALSAVAAIIGTAVLAVAMPRLEAEMLAIVGGRLPFWMYFGVRADSLIYVVVLAVAAAVVVGVPPALKATGKQVQTRLQTLSAGSGSGMVMGRLWTLLIILQVALTVAVLPSAMFFTWDGLRLRTGDAGFASRQFVSATLAMDSPTDPPSAAFRSRYGAVQEPLAQQLAGDAAVLDVTYSLVDAGQELAMVMEAEGRTLPPTPVDYHITNGSTLGHLVRYNRVAPNFFDALEVPVILGRGFTSADAGSDRVIVNRTLAQQVFGDTNPLGGRLKYVGRSHEAEDDGVPLERWYEVVGVAADFPANEFDPTQRLYHAATPADLYPARIGVKVRGSDPASFAGTLRDLTAAVSPALQVRDITTTEILMRREQGMFRIIGVTVGLVMLSVITLSAAGIYALMSFTVARRRREIGIRAALGANRNRLLAAVFARALGQLAAGALVGVVGAFGLEQLLEGDMLQGRGAVILPLVALVMAAVGALATIGPARQGLRIQPTEALRDE